MGRKGRKGFNWKARQNDRDPSTTQTCGESKIPVELDGVDALPPRKRKAIKDRESKAKEPVCRLSKKEKRRLKLIVRSKAQKTLRADLLKRLAEVQADPGELKHFVSTAEMQSQSSKRKRGNIGVLGPENKKLHTENVLDDSSSESSSDESTVLEDLHQAQVTDEVNVNASAQDLPNRENAKSVSAAEHNGAKSRKTSDLFKQESLSSQIALEKCVMNPEPTVTIKRANISLNRNEEIQKQRERLPVFMEEQMIMEKVSENPAVIICGETGSGKTTQLPQFLYEAGYAHSNGIIGITQPRRVAAISMARRVAEEMGLSSDEVSYQIRYEGTSTSNTKIKFMTDGVLLKEVQNDFELSNYSVIILDEAHERSVYTDILIGLLSGIVRIREKRGNPLKLILMSATLRVADFTENQSLFKMQLPVIEIKSRQFDVTLHFNRRTPVDDYLGEAYKKVCKIHRKLPAGGILVFVTSQQEVHTLCSKIRRAFPMPDAVSGSQTKAMPLKKRKKRNQVLNNLPKVNLDDYSSLLPSNEDEEGGLLEDFKEDSENEDAENFFEDSDDDKDELSQKDECTASQPVYVLPLYSLLPANKQAKVFQSPPPDCRLCVVSTNVAETSITIPGIKYVVDTGKVKTKFFDNVTGVSTFRVTWISKASANQRMGRAGRVAPGHCYRLYSSAVFMDFEEFTAPEITRRPVDDLVLLMRDIGIDRVANFPLPTAPPVEAFQTAEKNLLRLGALEVVKSQTTRDSLSKKTQTFYRLTDLARSMAKYPVAPAFAKMLCIGNQHSLLPYVVIIVAALSVQEVFIEAFLPADNNQEKEARKQKWSERLEMKKKWAGTGNSLLLGDVMVLLKAVCFFELEVDPEKFCETNGVRYKAMIEIRKLRRHLTNAINEAIPEAGLVLDPSLDPPTDIQAKLLRQIVLSGLGHHVAKKIPKRDGLSEQEARKLRNAYQDFLLVDPVYIHPNSVLYKSNTEYVVYQSCEEASAKIFIKGVTAVETDWLPMFVPTECRFSDPMKDPPPFYDSGKGSVMCYMSSTFGPQFWDLPPIVRTYPDGVECCRHFAQFFLQGRVCKKLKQLAKNLVQTAELMTKPYACRVERAEQLLRCLVLRKDKEKATNTGITKGGNGFLFVCNKSRLSQMWDNDSHYLLKEYCDWLPKEFHSKVSNIWPPL